MSYESVSLTTPPQGYAEWLAELKSRILTAQQCATLAEYKLLESLPPELQTSLPSIEQIEREPGGADGSDDSAEDDEES